MSTEDTTPSADSVVVPPTPTPEKFIDHKQLVVVDPDAYEYVGQVDLTPDDPLAKLALGDDMARQVLQSRKNPPTFGVGKCDHCGQPNNYVVVYRHKESRDVLGISWPCAVEHLAYPEADLRISDRHKAVVVAPGTENPGKMAPAAEDLLSSHPDLAPHIGKDVKPRHPALQRYKDELWRTGSLSPESIRIVRSIIRLQSQPDIERSKDKPAKYLDVAVGDLFTFRGTFLSCSTVKGLHADRVVLVFATDEQNVVRWETTWATVPEKLVAAGKGKPHHFTAYAKAMGEYHDEKATVVERVRIVEPCEIIGEMRILKKAKKSSPEAKAAGDNKAGAKKGKTPKAKAPQSGTPPKKPAKKKGTGVTMKVQKSELVSMLVNVGFKNVTEYDNDQLLETIKKLPKTAKDVAPKDKDEAKLLASLIKAVEKDDDIEIVSGKSSKKKPAKKADAKKSKGGKKKPADDDEDEEDEDDDEDEDEDEDEDDDKPAKKKGGKKSSKPAKKKPAKKSKDEDDDDDEDEEEDDDKPAKKNKKSAKKSKKSKGPKSAGGDGKPGIIESIVEFLSAASQESPLSKKSLLKKLAKRFPDREEDAMKQTINAQVPTRLRDQKGLNVKKNDDGFWISGKKKAKK